MNRLQQQRQQFLQKQHIQLQKLAAGNKFQEIFATATIIQSNPNDKIKKPITPTNGTFLLEPHLPIADIENEHVPILDTSPAHIKRKQHRKHYNHHRRNQKLHNNNKQLTTTYPQQQDNNGLQQKQQQNQQQHYIETPLNPPTAIVQEPIVYTSMPIPLILNSNEDKRPTHHAHAHSHGERKGSAQARKRTTTATVSGYDAQTYLNPFLAGELIFEK